MNFQELETKIKHLIATDKVEAAIKLLLTHFHNDERLDDILLQSGRYHSTEDARRKGIIDFAEVQKTLSQLRGNILAFIRLEKEEAALASESNTENLSHADHTIAHFRLSMASVCVIWILNTTVNEPFGLTIGHIHKLSKLKSRKVIVTSLQEMVKTNVINKQKVGQATHWKLADKGKVLAQELEHSLLFDVITK